jgi:hypothetical protein
MKTKKNSSAALLDITHTFKQYGTPDSYTSYDSLSEILLMKQQY